MRVDTNNQQSENLVKFNLPIFKMNLLENHILDGRYLLCLQSFNRVLLIYVCQCYDDRLDVNQFASPMVMELDYDEYLRINSE